MENQKVNVIVGYVGGVWNNNEKKFEVKSGSTKAGKAFASAQIKVSSKGSDGTWTNGGGISFTVYGEDAAKIVDGAHVALTGYFKPNNYTSKDSKEVRGNEFVVTAVNTPTDKQPCQIWGYVTGIWNNTDKKFEVRSGTSKAGKQYASAQIKVASKASDGTWTNGKGIAFTVWGEDAAAITDGALVEFTGFFSPKNFTTKDGKEIRDNEFVVTALGVSAPSAPAAQESKPEPQPEPAQPESSVIDDDDPFA